MMFDDKETAKLFDVDVENMKVIEIKKRLKALGLPVTGNKSELVERLQVAMISGKEADVESSNLDTASLPDSIGDSSPNKLNDQLLDDSPPFKEKYLAQDLLVSSVATSVPLKKRAVLQTDDETVKPKKKIVLNRNNFPTPILISEAEPLQIKADIETGNEREDSIAIESGEITGISAKSGCVKKVIYLTTETKKSVSDSEKIMMRAKRFNLTTESIKAQSTLDPAKSKKIKEWKSKAAAITPLTSEPNIDVLRKRAERFGENVSTVLKKLEDEEKINKRKSKFGQDLEDIKVTGLDDQDKKKMRAERFGKIL